MNKPLKICIEIPSKEDADITGLRLGIEAMEQTSPLMRKATLEYLWDRYITEHYKKIDY